MTVVFVASEAVPIAKVGGLADVVGSLPKALEQLALEVKIIIPKYGVIDSQKYPAELVASNFEVFFAGKLEKFRVFTTILPNSTVEVYLVDHPFFENGVYLSPDATPKSLTEVKRFAFFSIAALEFLSRVDFNTDVLHLNDWHTALIPIFKKIKYGETKLANSATLLTIHNLGEAYQGIVRGKFLQALDLEPEPVVPLFQKFKFLKRLNIFKSLNFLEQGVKTANILATVSPQYAKEIQLAEFGGELAAILKKRSNILYGILNGIDYETFNPTSDRFLVANYATTSWKEGKSANKKFLKETAKLLQGEKLLIGLVTRIDEQKGLSLLIAAADTILSLGSQIVLLGKGNPKIEKQLANIAKKNPDNFAFFNKFDPQLANQIYAGCDCFLMPSKFEPCGLGQMIAQAYGTIPIVRDVGGLHDTVEDGVTGFKFSEFTPPALVQAVGRAVTAFENGNLWTKMVGTAMSRDFSWGKSAAEYVKLYERALRSRSTEQ